MSDTYALKDNVNRVSIRRLGEQIQTAWDEFPVDGFVRRSCRGLSDLELTQRTRHVAGVLRAVLPQDIPEALKILRGSFPGPLPTDDAMYGNDFWLWPLSDFVRDYAADHWQDALDTCYGLTQCFTSEFAIRPLLKNRPDDTLRVLQEWASDPSEHVRRLCSEGTRPRLPWAGHLKLPLDQVLPILSTLKEDPSRYVQRSVANHLNDLSRIDPDLLLETLEDWNTSDHEATQWIIGHALRTLIKQGHPRALKLQGYGPAKLENVHLSVTPDSVAIGEDIYADVSLQTAGRKTQRLLVDWVMHYVKASGDTSAKVFKGKQVELAGGESVGWTKKFGMVVRSTRVLYPGQHRLELQVNGEVVAGTEFELTES